LDEVAFGPVQLMVIIFDNSDFQSQIHRELETVMNKGIIRLIGMLSVWKDEDGNVTYLETTQLNEEEKMCFGAFMGGLIGYGAGGEEGAMEGKEAGIFAASRENYGVTEEDILEITEAVPENTAAAVLIIEHLWAKDLNRAVRDAGGVLVSQGILTPELLIAVGEDLAETVKFAGKKKPGSRTKSAV
jgi:uncharacterized membrane protein